MPKYRGEINKIDDPSLRDLMEGKDLADRIKGEIRELYGSCDPILSQEYGYPISDPDQIMTAIEYLRRELGPLPKPEQEAIRRSLRELRERVILVYPAFLEQLIDQFGHARSKGREPRMDVSEIRVYFVKARDTERDLPEQKLLDYEVSLRRLEHRFVLFQKEVRYFLFEQEAERLRSKLWNEIYTYNDHSWRPERAIADAGESLGELQHTLASYEKEVERLSQLAQEFQDPLVKSVAQDEITHLESLLEVYRRRMEEPGQYRPSDRHERQATTLSEAYRILGFSQEEGPSRLDVKRQYIALAQQYHPDRVGDEGTRRMSAVNAAMSLIREAWELDDATKKQ